MKKLTLIFTLILSVTLTLSAQNNSNKSDLEKTVTQVSENIYSIEVNDEDGFIIQKGEYYSNGKTLLPHGIWTLYAHKSNNVLTRIKYNEGEKIWLETFVNGEMKRMNKEEITIHKLQTRIAALEKKVEAIE